MDSGTTNIFRYADISVEYKERQAQQDRHHLIVVFSGFRPKHSPYDFDGAASTTLRAHLLWIRDDFDGNMTYYIRDKNGYEISEAVNALIESKRAVLGLSKEQCTFIGFSKGGTAALYHGLKYEYPNILVSAPRIRVGSANQVQRPDIIEGMTQAGSQAEIAELDALLPDLIRARQSSGTNLYWFSSLTDHFHATETGPLLEELRKFRNFNYFETNSDLVRRHKDVTLYNMPLIMSILGALGEGTPPRFGERPNGGNSHPGKSWRSLSDIRGTGEIVQELSTLKVDDGRLWIQGVSFAKGVPAPRANHIRTEIALRGSERTHRFSLEQVENTRLSNRYYESAFCDYSFGAHAAPGGIDLSDVPNGVYRLESSFRQAKRDYPPQTLTWIGDASISVLGESIVQVRPTRQGSLLVKRPLLADLPTNFHFSLADSWLEDNTFQIRGSFVIHGHEATTHQDVKFWAVLVPELRSELQTVPLFTYREDFRGESIGDPWGVYTHSNFATRRNRGVQLPKLPADVYEVVITAAFTHGAVFSCSSGVRILVSENGESVVSRSSKTVS